MTIEADREDQAVPTLGDVEDTDLERRVLAHERILQVLIAHLSKAEPKFMERLSETFGGPRGLERREHDYVDTNAYAGQFIRAVEQLSAQTAAPPPPAETERPPKEPPLPAPNLPARGRPVPVETPAIVLLRVQYRRLLWEVTRNGSFYGHYHERQPALEAALAAAKAVVAQGGGADVVLEDESGSIFERAVRTMELETPDIKTPPYTTPAFTTPEPTSLKTKPGEPGTTADPSLR